MPRANLTITIPEGVWIGEVTRAHPEARVKILAAIADGEIGVGLAEVSGDAVDAVLEAIRDAETVTTCECLQRHEDTALVQFETTVPLLLFAVQDSGVPLEMPFTIQDGQAEWSITAPQDRLSTLGEKLEDFGIPFTVEAVTQRLKAEQLLTDPQLDLLQQAVEAGYYDTPRECTLTELADIAGLAKSTCSETLHRAEEQIVKQFLEGAENTTVALGRP